MEALQVEAGVLKVNKRQEAFEFRKICDIKLSTQFLSLKDLIPHNHHRSSKRANDPA